MAAVTSVERPVDRVLAALRRRGPEPRRHATGWSARCPAHDDRNPSLSVGESDTGAALVNCHAGCTAGQVVAALGLGLRDLFPAPERNTNGLRRVVGNYPYWDEHGELLYEVVRYQPKNFRQRRPDGRGGWVWNLGDTRRVLFRLPQVRRAVTEGRTVYLCEGEKDVLALEAVDPDLVATTAPGGAKWADEFTEQLAGAAKVVIIPDRDADETGYRHARRVAAALRGRVGRVIVARPDAGKDVADHLAAGRRLVDLVKLDDTAQPTGWTDDAPLEPADAGEPHGWEAVDLGPLLAGDYQPPRPAVLARIDGQPLLYAGRVNAVHGESGAGKTWVALAAAAEQLTAGRAVLYVDLEDHAEGVAGRLRELGLHPQILAARFRYISPDLAFGDRAAAYLADLVAADPVTLAVIDSVGEAMALDGIKPNDDDDVARWYRRVPRWLAGLGPAVLLVDHVPKARDANPNYSIGSQRKRAAVDGAAYRVEIGVPPARGAEGRLRLVVAKDRAGTFPLGVTAAEMVVRSDGARVAVSLVAAGAPADPLAALMERISGYLEADGRARTHNQIIKNVRGGRDELRDAIRRLVDGGWVVVTENNQGRWHALARPYRVGEDLGWVAAGDEDDR